MKIYQSSLSFPEVAQLSKEERSLVCRGADQSVLQHEGKKRAVGIGIVIALVLAGISIGRDYGFLGGMVGGAIGAGLGSFLLHQILVHAARPYVREALRRRHST